MVMAVSVNKMKKFNLPGKKKRYNLYIDEIILDLAEHIQKGLEKDGVNISKAELLRDAILEGLFHDKKLKKVKKLGKRIRYNLYINVEYLAVAESVRKEMNIPMAELLRKAIPEGLRLVKKQYKEDKRYRERKEKQRAKENQNKTN